MPELPEVETVVRELRPLLLGKSVHSVAVSRFKLRHPWEKKWNSLVGGKAIQKLKRRGKWIQMFLDDDSLVALHLGMTGQLTVHPTTEALADHVHLQLLLDAGAEELRFRDPRRFGSSLYFSTEEKWYAWLDEKLGPEPFDLEPRSWAEAVFASKRNLKALLLDQSLVAGVGNIYADESLHVAGLHPEQKGKQTSPAEAERLREAIVQVLTRAINGRGSTIRNYVGGSGLRGEYQEALLVYGRKGEPCGKCATPVEQLRLGGRSAHFCPTCQVKPKRKGGSKAKR
jgi:formamidopyrimidine-DNA glycosylase